jgi:16S rRNA (uracil1498-N3)-methyltransferase
MSRPRFFVANLPTSGSVALDEAEAKHAAGVLRLQVGDEVVLFDGAGGEALARIDDAHKRGMTALILERTDTNRELPCQLEMMVALPKGDRQRTLIDGLVQLGVAKLTPLETQRGVAQPTPSVIERLERAVLEASKQCGRNLLMEVGLATSIHELATSDTASNTLRLFAHPYGYTTSLNNLELQNRCRIAIGPEGGFTDAECQTLAQAGWQPVRLGPRILRIEFASLMVAAWWASQFE